MMDTEQDTTTYSIPAAGVRASVFQPGKWNAHALVPEQRRLATYDTREEAEARAAAFTEQVVGVLKRSRTLKERE